LLTWDPPDQRYFSHGLDRGVLFIPGREAMPWNGLQGFDENSAAATTLYYRDGVIYLADADAGDFTGQISAIFYPRQFGECIGIPEVADGFFADGQKPKRFGFSYRTLIGSGTKGDMFGYEIHLVYNCMASIGQRSRRTINGSSPEPTTFTFDVVSTPVKLTGFRPTAHFKIDTRGMDDSLIADLENLIYGDDVIPTEMPDPNVLYDMMNFGSAMIVTDHGDGTFSVEGSQENVPMIDDDHFQLNNINATAPDAAGHYVISPGGTTTVVVG